MLLKPWRYLGGVGVVTPVPRRSIEPVLLIFSLANHKNSNVLVFYAFLQKRLPLRFFIDIQIYYCGVILLTATEGKRHGIFFDSKR
jgi:hypothetical protein